MTPLSVQLEKTEADAPFYRAVAGKYRSVGKTAGEALDALIAQEGDTVDPSTIMIQRFLPDAYFTQGQHDRMKTLLACRAALTEDEKEELNALVDAELDAAISRSDALLGGAKQ